VTVTFDSSQLLQATDTALGATGGVGVGSYNDSAYFDNIDVTEPSTNEAPIVNAGADQSITLGDGATLDGTVTDDGLPDPPAAVTVTWSKTSGPGTVSFGDSSAVDTTASFSAAGTYILRLTADDSALTAYDEVQITVVSGAATLYVLDNNVNWDDPNVWYLDSGGSDPANRVPTDLDDVNLYFAYGVTIPTGYTAPASGGINGIEQRGGPLTIESGATLSWDSGDWDFSTGARLDVHGTMNAYGRSIMSIRDRISGAEVDIYAGATFNWADSTFALRHGDLAVRGSGSTINMNNFRFTDGDDGAELIYEADSGGFSTVYVAEHSGTGGTLDFQSAAARTLTVDVTALSPSSQQTWTLMEFDAISRDNNSEDWQTRTITGASDPNKWSITLTDPSGGNPGTLTVTYTP
jgi:hypothetical protein